MPSIWFLQGIYFEWLTSNVLWINRCNLHLMWNKKMVSLLYEFLQACCKFGPHFLSVRKIVHTSPGSHNKFIYMNCFCYAHKSEQVWELQYMLAPEISSLVLILCFACNLYPGYQDDDLGVCFLNLENANAWVVTYSLLGNLIPAKYIVM